MPQSTLRLALPLLLAASIPLAANAQTNLWQDSGNIGIGTTTPVGPLNVAGDGAASTNYNSYGQFFITGKSNTNQRLALAYDTANNCGLVQAYISSGPVVPLILQSAGGNVGIGASNPTALLQVGQTIDNQGLKVGISGNMANSNAEIRGSLAVLGHDANSASVAGAVAWDFYNDGNNPSWSGALLKFYGSNYSGNAYGLPAANQGAVVFQNVSNGVVASNGANIHIAPVGNVTATFLTNGNVGIGTTNPSYKLSVNGTIRAKEVIVEANWADYVFAEDYRLAPLSEVEAHIKAHKHLPGVPSAAQVAEQGVSMGEMQAMLLAKIEEMTLRQIAQEKEIVRLRERLAEVEASK